MLLSLTIFYKNNFFVNFPPLFSDVYCFVISDASNFLMKNGMSNSMIPKKKKVILFPNPLPIKSVAIMIMYIIILVMIPYATDQYSFL